MSVTIARQIDAVAEQRGMKTKDLLAEIGVPYQTYYVWGRGKFKARLKTVREIKAKLQNMGFNPVDFSSSKVSKAVEKNQEDKTDFTRAITIAVNVTPLEDRNFLIAYLARK